MLYVIVTYAITFAFLFVLFGITLYSYKKVQDAQKHKK